MIEIHKLNKSYVENERKIEIFKELDLFLKPKSKNLILGTSGIGKSTFLNLIGLIDLPDSGEIFIQSINVQTLTESGRSIFRRENIGFIFQFFNLIPTLTIRENILLPLELNNKLNDSDFAYELLDEVGLLNRIDSYPENLSGGQQQRVAIVRALVHRPKLVIADEPTGNLDPRTGNDVMKIIKNLIDESSATLLMATHNEKFSEIADRVLVIEDRKINDITKV